ncbi:MAG: hypothetical protein QOF30_367 [Acidimicrobiaceae bacterium]|nr:hypothetical protein [Acidimicrobiaceae bacterium]
MRLLFVVAEHYPSGGAAARWCEDYVARLAARGHEVEVLVAGDAGAPNGVVVHRLPVADEADPAHGGWQRLLRQCIDAGLHPGPDLQAEWLRGAGPQVPGLVDWLRDHGGVFDAVAVAGSASHMAWCSLTALAGWVPTVLHPLAGTDARLRLRVFATLLRQPSALAFVDHRELQVLRPAAGTIRTSAVVGCGLDVVELDELAQGTPFPCDDVYAAVDGRPYLLLVGGTAGCARIVGYFAAYKARHPGPLQLVVLGYAGDAATADVSWTAAPDRAARVAAMASAVATIESRDAPVLPVVWADRSGLRRPGLVETADAGDLRPEAGAVGFAEFTGFEAAVELLTTDEASAATLGDEGGRFVESRCQWDDLLDRYERLLHVIQTRR